jgi:hypothetical protein
MTTPAKLNEALRELDRLEADYKDKLRLLDGIPTDLISTRMALVEASREHDAVKIKAAQQQTEPALQQRFLQ